MGFKSAPASAFANILPMERTRGTCCRPRTPRCTRRRTAGAATYSFFTAELTDATRRRQKLEFDLQHALARDEFVLYYQPLVATETGGITGVEALLRWRHPEQGMIFPNQFVPQLEELGLMTDVGNWVLRTACMQNAAWQKAGLPPIRMMVNLSSTQFYRSQYCEQRKAGAHRNPAWIRNGWSWS